VAVFFTARRYASAVCGRCVSVCQSISLSHAKTAKRRFTQTMPYDSPGTLVFWR